MDLMNRILREKFVELYNMPILENVSAMVCDDPVFLSDQLDLLSEHLSLSSKGTINYRVCLSSNLGGFFLGLF